jgi:hypothetical protein
MPTWFFPAFITFASALSVFYAVFAVKIFLPALRRDNADRRAHRALCTWWVHQIWLNFLGSAVGWVCLWFVAVKLVPQFERAPDLVSFGWEHAALALVAFIGVTGYLPFTVVNLAVGLGTLMKAVGEKVGGG